MASLFALNSYASVYTCTGGSFDPVKVEVKSKTQLIINDKDTAKIDKAYDAANPDKKTYKLIGDISTLGNGAEGFSVNVTVSKYIFTDSKVAYLNTYNSGPEGYYSESYKCVKK